MKQDKVKKKTVKPTRVSVQGFKQNEAADGWTEHLRRFYPKRRYSINEATEKVSFNLSI